jgi:murein DD-endopeptidase MepM/ murein hydrolase activator NlpD/transcriptional regulator with XRE-family HTH domain
MQHLRSLRRHRSLTFLDLAALTGIPARRIAEIEYGISRLSLAERDTLALVLGLSPRDLTGAHPRYAATAQAARPSAVHWTSQALAAALLATAIATGAISAVAEDLPRLSAPAWGQVVASGAPTVAPTTAPTLISGAAASLAVGAAGPIADEVRLRTLVGLLKRANLLSEELAPALLAGPTPDESVAPAPLPVIESVAALLPPSEPPPVGLAAARPPVNVSAEAFTLSADGPLGCPVQPTAGRVVMTQGYGVGTHAPATVWGAVDLAVDSNDDGYADHAGSWYQPIVATHDGHVSVSLDSYPGGNYVSVRDPSGVWRTGYAHLALVTVSSGQFVRAGEQIGLLGSTGMSTGPHLDYQVWRSGVNIDPTWLVGCTAP